jgi:hypothetical protein
VPGKGAAPSAEELREHLSHTLPRYLIPSAYVLIETLPLTGNGKLDRAGLPPVPRAVLSTAAPRTDSEREVAALWSELLGIAELDRTRTFFDSGGNSLLLIQLAESITAAYPESGFKVSDLFEHNTIARLGAALSQRRGAARPSS